MLLDNRIRVDGLGTAVGGEGSGREADLGFDGSGVWLIRYGGRHVQVICLNAMY